MSRPRGARTVNAFSALRLMLDPGGNGLCIARRMSIFERPPRKADSTPWTCTNLNLKRLEETLRHKEVPEEYI
jgi:hypothetical protein